MPKLLLSIAIILSLIVPPISPAYAERDRLTQVSTIDALLNSVFDGETTLKELQAFGDFGLGTFNKLDGEMIMLDGVIYQIRGDGSVHVPAPDTKTPFAAITFFDSDASYPLPALSTIDSLERFIDAKIGSINVFYAVKISGTFKTLKARSVPAQVKPYRDLKSIINNQSIFEFREIQGTIVGLRSPPFAKGFNLPGYHLHFISANGKAGGHVLALELTSGTLEIDETSELRVYLPKTKEFLDSDLSSDRARELNAIEK